MKDLLTEEEYIKLIESTVCYAGKAEDLNTKESVLSAKTLGYIKENPVDKAKKWYDEENSHYSSRELEIINDFSNAIEYLEKELEDERNK